MGKFVKSIAFPMLLSAVVLGGCAEQQHRADIAQSVTVPGVTTAEAVDAAEIVLRQMRFSIEKADARAGIVTTAPLTGGQFFEFWRSDNVGLDATLEANLHTLRRSVQMDFDRVDDQVRIRCTIRVQRLSLPENEVASVSQAYRIYSRSTPTMQRLDLNPSQREAMSWIDLGDDPKLSAEILRKITQNIEQPEKDETT